QRRDGPGGWRRTTRHHRQRTRTAVRVPPCRAPCGCRNHRRQGAACPAAVSVLRSPSSRRESRNLAISASPHTIRATCVPLVLERTFSAPTTTWHACHYPGREVTPARLLAKRT